MTDPRPGLIDENRLLREKHDKMIVSGLGELTKEVKVIRADQAEFGKQLAVMSLSLKQSQKDQDSFHDLAEDLQDLKIQHALDQDRNKRNFKLISGIGVSLLAIFEGLVMWLKSLMG